MTEMNKIFSSRNAHIAIQKLHQFQILPECLKLPEHEECKELKKMERQNHLLGIKICNVIGVIISTLKASEGDATNILSFLNLPISDKE